MATPVRSRRAFLFALALLAAGPVVACGDVRPPTAAAPQLDAVRTAAAESDAPTDSAAVRRRLERAAGGLLYTSESDHPFEYVFLAAELPGPVTGPAFHRAAGLADGTPVEERTLDDFFAGHIERVDPNDSAAVALVPRYRALKRTLATAVRGARVFRVGRVVIRCYLVGTDARGNVVGLATTAVET